MTLSNLIRKGGLAKVATATPATVATQAAATVAEVATVAVAKPPMSATNDDMAAEASREAAEERAAILEYDGGLPRPEAERIAALAQAFYNHLFGTAKATGCCYAKAERYCPEGRRLRDAYYGAVH